MYGHLNRADFGRQGCAQAEALRTATERHDARRIHVGENRIAARRGAQLTQRGLRPHEGGRTQSRQGGGLRGLTTANDEQRRQREGRQQGGRQPQQTYQ
ncbi:MAG: hypothetical protein CAK89_03635 [Opitutia bacterium AMD-G3]|nr:MAG: hypothetical protein CAK89_03635 [Opitutae bacterium AMD-G3]